MYKAGGVPDLHQEPPDFDLSKSRLRKQRGSLSLSLSLALSLSRRLGSVSPKPYILHPTPSALFLHPDSCGCEPGTLVPKTLNPKPYTLNPKP